MERIIMFTGKFKTVSLFFIYIIILFLITSAKPAGELSITTPGNNIWEESEEYPLQGVEFVLKLSGSNKTIEKKSTDAEGKCSFPGLKKSTYQVYLFNLNSKGIDSILTQSKLTRKDIKTFIFRIKFYLNDCIAQFEVEERTPAQINQKISESGMIAEELSNIKENGHIDILVTLEPVSKIKKSRS
jgi:hypothetical protein